MLFSKSKKINIEKGRRIFFEYKGDSFGIDRDIGSEYWDCNIPKELEELWRKEMQEQETKKSK